MSWVKFMNGNQNFPNKLAHSWEETVLRLIHLKIRRISSLRI